MKVSTLKSGVVWMLVFSFWGFSEVCARGLKRDSLDQSVISYFLKKERPKFLNVDFHMRAGLLADFSPFREDRRETAFRFDQLILAVQGNITDKLSYKYVQRFNRKRNVSVLENLSNGIDYAYLNYRFNDKVAVMVGRQALMLGGFEYDEFPVNVYGYSGITNNISCYLTGVNFSFMVRPNQEIVLQVINNRTGTLEEAFGKDPEKVKKPGAPLYYSLAWNSNYCENKLKLRYGASAGELVKGEWVYMISGGELLQLGKFRGYFDVLYQRSGIDHLGVVRSKAVQDNGEAWEGITQSVDYLTLVLDMNYRFHSCWNVHLKGFYDRASVFEENKIFQKGAYLSSWGYQGALEYYPMADDNCHFYLNVCGKAYKDFKRPNWVTPGDNLQLALGVIYRLPVL